MGTTWDHYRGYSGGYRVSGAWGSGLDPALRSWQVSILPLHIPCPEATMHPQKATEQDVERQWVLQYASTGQALLPPAP